MTEVPFLSGKQIYLRGLRDGNAPAMSEWLNDDEVTRLLYQGVEPVSPEAIAQMWGREKQDAATVSLAVCTHDGDRFIGTAGLYQINWVMRSADFRIFIGDKTYFNRGIGTECTKLIVAYGFEKLNLNRIALGVNAENVAAVRAYEKAGFVREGVHRQEQYRNFRYYDVIRMSVLRDEFAALREKRGRA